MPATRDATAKSRKHAFFDGAAVRFGRRLRRDGLCFSASRVVGSRAGKKTIPGRFVFFTEMICIFRLSGLYF